MASSGNHNQVGGGFDVQKFFKTSNPSNPNPSSSPPPGYEMTPSASQPSPSYTSPQLPNTSNFHPGPFSYPPHTSPFQPYMHYSPDTVQDARPPLRPPFSNAPLPTTHPHFPQQQPKGSPPQLPSSGVSAPNPGARLMALLGTQSSGADPAVSSINPDFSPPGVSSPPEFYPQLLANTSVIPPTPPLSVASPPPVATPSRVPSSKLPKGRHISGDHIVYDIDERLPGEVQPQLEVNPITKYGSDPGLVIGRQIAVNATYICYGLKLGAVRVLNINTASRHLLRGYSQRVTDMAFFAEDVHLLASASGDGRVFIWKITEDLNEEDKPQITGKLILAIQMVGDRELFHPRVCWHTHKQVKIWGERKSGPIAVLKPHDGQPVNSVTFSVAPERPDHIVLLTSVMSSVFATLYAYQSYLLLKLLQYLAGGQLSLCYQ